MSFIKNLLLSALFLSSLIAEAQPPKIKFENCDCYYFGSGVLKYSWYGGCKDGLADGYGILTRDTISPSYSQPINLYKTVIFKDGILSPDSILINQNRLVEKHFNIHESDNLGNYAYYTTYETKDKIFYSYRSGAQNWRYNPLKTLAVYDKTTEKTRLFIGVYLSPDGYSLKYDSQVWEKFSNSDWTKLSFTESCTYQDDCELTQWIKYMLAISLETNDPSIFYILSSETCTDIFASAIDNIYEKTFGKFYPELLSKAEKICMQENLQSFFTERAQGLWKPVPYLTDALNKNLSNCQSEISQKKAKEFGITVRHTFKNDNIGKRYVPVMEKRYTATVDEFYVNDEKIRITKDEKSTSGGYSETRNGYIAIYQVINESQDYLVIPITINGISKFTENIIEDNGFLFTRMERGLKSEYRPFRVTKTFLLGPNESVKDQLVTGEEIPSNFYIELGDIMKVDANWVGRLDKAFKGDAASLNLMLNDERAKPWQEELNKSFANSTLKNYSSLLDMDIAPVDDLSFDPDFESEVKVTLNNRSDKKLDVSFLTSFGKVSKVQVEPLKSSTVIFKVKGYPKESLKVTPQNITVIE